MNPFPKGVRLVIPGATNSTKQTAPLPDRYADLRLYWRAQSLLTTFWRRLQHFLQWHQEQTTSDKPTDGLPPLPRQWLDNFVDPVTRPWAKLLLTTLWRFLRYLLQWDKDQAKPDKRTDGWIPALSQWRHHFAGPAIRALAVVEAYERELNANSLARRVKVGVSNPGKWDAAANDNAASLGLAAALLLARGGNRVNTGKIRFTLMATGRVEAKAINGVAGMADKLAVLTELIEQEAQDTKLCYQYVILLPEDDDSYSDSDDGGHPTPAVRERYRAQLTRLLALQDKARQRGVDLSIQIYRLSAFDHLVEVLLKGGHTGRYGVAVDEHRPFTALRQGETLGLPWWRYLPGRDWAIIAAMVVVVVTALAYQSWRDLPPLEYGTFSPEWGDIQGLAIKRPSQGALISAPRNYDNVACIYGHIDKSKADIVLFTLQAADGQFVRLISIGANPPGGDNSVMVLNLGELSVRRSIIYPRVFEDPPYNGFYYIVLQAQKALTPWSEVDPYTREVAPAPTPERDGWSVVGDIKGIQDRYNQIRAAGEQARRWVTPWQQQHGPALELVEQLQREASAYLADRWYVYDDARTVAEDPCLHYRKIRSGEE